MTMGILGEKITFILKKKTFLFAGKPPEKWVEMGVGREPVKLWKKWKKCKLKCEVKKVIGNIEKTIENI